jgi:hypothetical protein
MENQHNPVCDIGGLNMTKLKYFALGFAVALIVTAILFYFTPDPKPEIITKIVEVPSTENPDLTIKAKVKLTGQAKITPIPSPGPVDQNGNQPPESPLENGAVLALKIDSVIVTELTGEQKINYYNSDGALVGSGVHPVTAKLTTKVLPDGLDFSLEFPDEVSVKIDYKPPNLPQWELTYWLNGDAEIEFKPSWLRLYGLQVKGEYQKNIYTGKDGGKIGVAYSF